MRLLSLIPSMGVGGAEVVAAVLAEDALRRGYDVRLASGGGFRADEVAAAGVVHHELPLASRRPADLARSVVRLRALVRAWRPDLVHAHNVKAAVVARLAVGRQVPVLTTLHGVADEDTALGARLLRAATDRLVAVSPHVASTMTDRGFPADRLAVVENAVAPPRSHPRAEARRLLGIADDAVVALCPARLVEQKRHDLLVAAWHRLDAPGVLLVAGDGPTRERVTAQAAAGRRAGDIRMLGARQDVDRLLAAADLVVLSTDWEGMPISVLEAMSTGTPVVASRVGGVLETLGDGLRLVEPGSVDALADALTEVLTSDSERTRLGEAGRRLVAELYPLGAMLDSYDEQYALTRGRTAPAALATDGGRA